MTRTLSAVLLVLALAACGSAGGPEDGAQSEGSTQADDGHEEHTDHTDDSDHADHTGHSESLYAADIARAQDDVATDFEKDVLADGVITDEEYAAAQELLLACVAERGHTATHREYGTYDVDGDDADEAQAVLAGCADGTTATIEPIYWGMKINPERRSSADLIAECLLAASLVDEGFSGEDFARSFEDPPYDAEDPAAVECMSRPTM